MRRRPEDISLAIDTLNESEILKIEVNAHITQDVLPLIMDNIKIDSFKEKLDECIRKYEEENIELKVYLMINKERC